MTSPILIGKGEENLDCCVTIGSDTSTMETSKAWPRGKLYFDSSVSNTSNPFPADPIPGPLTNTTPFLFSETNGTSLEEELFQFGIPEPQMVSHTDLEPFYNSLVHHYHYFRYHQIVRVHSNCPS